MSVTRKNAHRIRKIEMIPASVGLNNFSRLRSICVGSEGLEIACSVFRIGDCLVDQFEVSFGEFELDRRCPGILTQLLTNTNDHAPVRRENEAQVRPVSLNLAHQRLLIFRASMELEEL